MHDGKRRFDRKEDGPLKRSALHNELCFRGAQRAHHLLKHSLVAPQQLLFSSYCNVASF